MFLVIYECSFGFGHKGEKRLDLMSVTALIIKTERIKCS